MTSNSDSLPRRGNTVENISADKAGDSDDEDVFHDARFPAEEEQVS